ncbi:MAG: hypothetical protein AB7O62_00055 [Pirellulales bacterium]
MINVPNQLRVSLEQMDKLLAALADLQQTILPRDPNLFAVMAEAPLDDLARLRIEIRDYLGESKPVA